MLLECVPAPALLAIGDDVIQANSCYLRRFGTRPATLRNVAEHFSDKTRSASLFGRASGHVAHESMVAKTTCLVTAPPEETRVAVSARGTEVSGLGNGSIWTIEDLEGSLGARSAATEDWQVFLGHPRPMWMTNAMTGAFVAINDAGVRWLGFSREILLRLSIHDLFSDDPFHATPWNLGGRAGAQARRQVRQRLGSQFPEAVVSICITLAGQSIRLSACREERPSATDGSVPRSPDRSFENLAHGMPDVLVRTRRDGTLAFANRAVERYTRSPASAVLGQRWRQWISGGNASRIVAGLARTAIRTRNPATAEAAWDILGRPHRFEITAIAEADDDGRIESLLWLARDIGDAHEALEHLQVYHEVFAQSRHGVLITDLAGRITDVNAAFSAITGYARHEAIGRTPAMLASGRHGEDFYSAMWRELQERGQWRGEVWNRRRTGEVYPESLLISTVHALDGRPLHYLGQFRDITDRKKAEARIQHLAQHDHLTDLPNRVLLFDRASVAFSRAKRTATKVAVVCLDLDNFKAINDSLGYRGGDDVLRAAAARCKSVVRASDTVSRQGGDEFVLLLEDIANTEAAARQATRLIEALAVPVDTGGQSVRVTASVGLALYPDDGADLDTLLRCGDSAMYTAKQRGRGRFAFYTPGHDDEAAERLGLENDLHLAIEQGRLSVAFQPQWSFHARRIVGFEALVRWRHPSRGLVPPSRFIPIAEECGLIHTIGDWVLREAGAAARHWTTEGLPFGRVAVNVSALQLRETGFTERVDAVLAENGLSPRQLEIEITESVLMDPDGMARARTVELADLGVGLALDDFGTGFSSLSYLSSLNLDRLKIDQSFVRDLVRGSRARELLKGIVDLGHSLGISVVAEGVETREEGEFLAAIDCDEGQGFHYGIPTGRHEVGSVLQGRAIH